MAINLDGYQPFKHKILVDEQANDASSTVGGSASAPTIAFGDGDTGFYESTDDTLTFTAQGVAKLEFTTAGIGGTETNSGLLLNETPSATNPTFSFDDDNDTGIGRAAANQLSLIAGGVEAMRLTASGIDLSTVTSLNAVCHEDQVVCNNNEIVFS